METLSGSISIREIFLCQEAWISFWIKYAIRLRWGILYNVAKMLLCRSGLGYSEYTCPDCGATKKVYHTCKSRFCSSCGKAYADKWSEESLDSLLDVSYKHLYFTLPEEFRVWFRYNRKTMPEVLFTAVRKSLLEFSSERGFTPGIIMALHTFGSAMKWNVHVHVIITAGGLSKDNKKWIPQYVIPHLVIKPMYRYRFLTLMSKEFKEGKLKVPKEHKHIKTHQTFESYLTQFHNKNFFVGLGKSLQDPKSKVKYVARYTRRPVLAESKITAFDEENVTFQYDDKSSGERTTKTCSVEEFIMKLVTHIPDPNFRLIRNAGIFSNRTKGEKLPAARNALKLPPTTMKNKITYRQMYYQAFAIDPLICNKCKTEMQLTNQYMESISDVKISIMEKHTSILDYFYNRQFSGFT